MTAMKICLVGNGKFIPSLANPSEEVDACDLVCRLNRCTCYYEGWTGFKTDMLVVRSALDLVGQKMTAKYHFTIPTDVVEQVKTFVVIGQGPHDNFDTALTPYLARYTQLQEAEQKFIPFETWYENIFSRIKIPDEKHPTIGGIALDMLLRQYPDAEFCLAGFNYSTTEIGRNTHAWKEEQEWILDNPRFKILNLIDKKVQDRVARLARIKEQLPP
jgi:hypothetical protein